MQVQLRHQPSFSVARLLLAPGEPAQVESGAMMATSYGVDVQAHLAGGVGKALGRMFSGESVFQSTFTAPPNGGWVDIADRLPGDLQVIELDGRVGWLITYSRWLASAYAVELQTKFGGATSIFGDRGAFLSRVSGQGPVVVSCYGALETVTLRQGEYITIDTGHVVAFAETVQHQVRGVTSGIMQSITSGEGLVFDFAGPGQVIVQTRNINSLSSWVVAQVPSRS